MIINYQLLMNEAVLNIVRKVLTIVQNNGSGGNHSLYISFLTHFEGVVLSKSVKQKYKQEITIVLQHQFDNLKVFEDKFTVNISFGGVNEDIAVPFASLTSFLDPEANFGFQFTPRKPASENNDVKSWPKSGRFESSNKTKKSNLSIVNKEKSNVIAIDQFRKKRESDTKDC